VIGSLLFTLAALLNHLILAFESARAAERSVLEMQVLARDAELRALRAQLNPHFLFNSLNAIGSLAGADPARARQMTAQLAEFLRRSMTLGARTEITLAEELELADRYLAVEQVRFGERLRVERRVAPDALECRVPPLVLQPLIENAVTHGIAGLVDGGVVSIEARRVGSRLELSVENPFDPERPARRGHGLGLENVRQRLATQQPGLTTVEAHEAFDRFRVDVRLPATVDGPLPSAVLPQPARAGDAR
jgi:LytS/YehU family sensor histidine kinase